MRRLLLIALLAACSDTEGVDIVIAPDPNVNTVQELRAEVDSLLLIVDSPDGLYEAGQERSEGSVQIENADMDLEFLEVVVPIGWTSEELPTIRLERGSLPDVSLSLRLYGLPPSMESPVAFGQTQGVELTRPPEEVTIPFNLRADMLAPRVTEVIPGSGSHVLCGGLKVLVVFSKPIDPSTLDGAFAVSPGGLSSGPQLDSSGLVAELGLQGVNDGMTTSFRLGVAPTITDESGRALDQVPAQQGAQPFEQDFAYPCDPPPLIPDPPPCSSEAPEGACTAPSRFACIEGECRPVRCDDADCIGGTSCQEGVFICQPSCGDEAPLCRQGECQSSCEP